MYALACFCAFAFLLYLVRRANCFPLEFPVVILLSTFPAARMLWSLVSFLLGIVTCLLLLGLALHEVPKLFVDPFSLMFTCTLFVLAHIRSQGIALLADKFEAKRQRWRTPLPSEARS
jgi:hypothetical protein